MKSHSWNISNPEGKLFWKMLLSILHHQSKMTIGEIGTKLKEKAIADKIMFYRDGKEGILINILEQSLAEFIILYLLDQVNLLLFQLKKQIINIM